MLVCLFRVLFLGFMLILLCFFSLIFSLFFFCDYRKTYFYARFFGLFSKCLGITVDIRGADKKFCSSVYVANHQNNYDLFTLTRAVQAGTVSIGKRSLVFIPFFGLIYWISGNILIDRRDSAKAKIVLKKIACSMKERLMSIWFFPEGTRYPKKGMLPFKLGAFHTAIQAGVPIIPIVASFQGDIKLSKYDNGKVIVQILPEISTENYSEENVRELAEITRDKMIESYNSLNAELSIDA